VNCVFCGLNLRVYVGKEKHNKHFSCPYCESWYYWYPALCQLICEATPNGEDNRVSSPDSTPHDPECIIV
jgi:hypothetical protein